MLLHTWVKGYGGTIMFMYKYVGELSKEMGGSPHLQNASNHQPTSL